MFVNRCGKVTKNNSQPMVRVKIVDGVEVRHLQYQDARIDVMYKEDGIVLPTIPLSGHYVEQYISFMLLDKDLRNVVLWCEMIKDITDSLDKEQNFQEPDVKKNILIKSLFVSMVTIYGKCFTEAKGRRFKLERKLIPEEYKELHDGFMNTRHNFTAHKGDFKYDTGQMNLLLRGKKKKMHGHIFSELQQVNFMSNDNDLEKAIKLCEHLRNILRDKSNQLLSKIYEEKIYTKDIKYWLGRNKKTTGI